MEGGTCVPVVHLFHTGELATADHPRERGPDTGDGPLSLCLERPRFPVSRSQTLVLGGSRHVPLDRAATTAMTLHEPTTEVIVRGPMALNNRSLVELRELHAAYSTPASMGHATGILEVP